MNCEYFRELISGRLDGELSPDEERQLDEHLNECPSCRELAGYMGDLKEVVGNDKPETLPPGVEKQILEKTMQAPKRRSLLREFIGGYYRVPKGLAWATFVLFLLLAANSFRVKAPSVDEEKAVIETAERVAVIQKVTLSQDDKVMSKTMTTDKESL